MLVGVFILRYIQKKNICLYEDTSMTYTKYKDLYIGYVSVYPFLSWFTEHCFSSAV